MISRQSKTRSHRASSAVTKSFASRQSLDELYEEGKRLRDKCPRQSHGVWQTPTNRPDPVLLLEQSSKGRVPQLIPVRYWRMKQTRSLSIAEPHSTWRRILLQRRRQGYGCRLAATVICSISGLSRPRKALIFDINDLDETLPAPWEWDVKRLAASFVLAVAIAVSAMLSRGTALSCVRSYRLAMMEFSRMRVFDVRRALNLEN